MRRLGHPSNAKLERWVRHGDTEIGRHLETCNYCADRLERLAAADEAGDLREALLRLLAVPDELPDRLRSGIDERLANRRDLVLFGELFGLPIEVVRIMTNSNKEEDED